MNYLRRWAVSVFLLAITSASIVWFQVATLAQTPSQLALEDAGLTLEELGEDVYGLIASTDFPPSNPDAAICNGGIVIGNDGVLVVDPFQNEALATLLYETVATLTDQPIRYVVNTHYHFDHTGGNAAAAALDYPILGRGPIREWMLERNLEMDPNATPPEIVVDEQANLWLGDRQVQLVDYNGHSGGTDLVVYVPDVDVLMTGDLLFVQRFPYAADGNIQVWQTNLEQLADQYSSAMIMPGHGPVTDLGGLEIFEGYLEYLEALALEWEREGLSQEEAIASVSIPDFYSDYLFQALFASNLETAYQQITLGNDDAASIQQYAAEQPEMLNAL